MQRCKWASRRAISMEQLFAANSVSIPKIPATTQQTNNTHTMRHQEEEEEYDEDIDESWQATRHHSLVHRNDCSSSSSHQGLLKKKLREYYAVGPSIGEGADGRVYIGKDLRTGKKVAIKILKIKSISHTNNGKTVQDNDVNQRALAFKEQQRERKRKTKALREIHILRRLQGHKGIVQLVDAFEERKRGWICIVMRYAKGGDLYDYLCRTGLPLDRTEVWRLFGQIVSAVKYAHGEGFIHRDLKPENIFLDGNNNVKIGDWGFGCAWSSMRPHKRSCGSFNFIASEVLSHRGYIGPEVDIFSLGAVLYTMLTGNLPFGPSGEGESLERALIGDWRMHPALTPSDIKFLDHLLDPLPLRRATMYDIHRYLKMRRDSDSYPVLNVWQLGSPVTLDCCWEMQKLERSRWIGDALQSPRSPRRKRRTEHLCSITEDKRTEDFVVSKRSRGKN